MQARTWANRRKSWEASRETREVVEVMVPLQKLARRETDILNSLRVLQRAMLAIVTVGLDPL
jgi:hypothetical protein